MATSIKKYAGLPDIDLDEEEVFETQVPELTEASTLPTESTDASDEDDRDAANDNATTSERAFDRRALDPNAARARFEPAVIDARNVNFSDTIAGGRRDYRIQSRRRRRRRAIRGNDWDSDSDSEPETLEGRLARLKREAAEIQAELDRIDNNDKPHSQSNGQPNPLLKVDHDDDDGDSAYEDTVDHHPHNVALLSHDLDQVKKTLDAASRRKKPTSSLESEFLQSLDGDPRPAKPRQGHGELASSTISAITDFADRLTALESVLGLSQVSATTATPVLPMLNSLATQIDTLHSTLSPRLDTHQHDAPRSTVHLDPLAAKVRALMSESKRLEESRRAAAKSFEELLEQRDRHASLYQHTVGSGTESRPGSGERSTTKHDLQQQFTTLFLDDQASKITALYNMLPTIQEMQPLLPVVLERLRALSVLHTGATGVRHELDDMTTRLTQHEADIKLWRNAVEQAEAGVREGKESMKENVTTIGEAVKRLESRVKDLHR